MPIPESYLRATYGTDFRERVKEQLSTVYHRIFDSFWPAASRFFEIETIKPEMLIVHSMSARAMHIRSAASECVIYDQYLGQIFSTVTRLVLNEASRDHVDEYFNKLLGQRCFISGQFGTALLIAASRQNREKLDPIPESAATRHRRSTLTLGQEAFAIGHEIGHILMKQAPDAGRPLATEYAQTVADALIAADFMADPKMMESAWQEYVSDRDRALAADGIFPPTPGSAAYEEFLSLREEERCAFMVPDADIEQLKRDFPTNHRLAEESLCDMLGFLSSLLFHRNNPDATMDSHIAAVESSVLALHNLRLIEAFDVKVKGHFAPNETPVDVNREFHESMVRLSALRQHIKNYSRTSDWGVSYDSTHNAAVDVNRLYAKAVMDRMLFAYDFEVYLSRGHRLDDDYAALAPDQKSTVRAILGF